MSAPRPEPPILRALRQVALDLRQARAIDLLAMCIGYALLIGLAVVALVAAGVWLGAAGLGREPDLLTRISAALAALD